MFVLLFFCKCFHFTISLVSVSIYLSPIGGFLMHRNFIGLLAILDLLITPAVATDLLPITGPSLSDIFGLLIIILHHEMPVTDISPPAVFSQTQNFYNKSHQSSRLSCVSIYEIITHYFAIVWHIKKYSCYTIKISQLKVWAKVKVKCLFNSPAVIFLATHVTEWILTSLSEEISVPTKKEPKQDPERKWLLTGREKEHDTEKRFPVRCCGARHEATVYIPAAKNSFPGHCDSSQASHVTQGSLVPSCQLNSSPRIHCRECLQ